MNAAPTPCEPVRATHQHYNTREVAVLREYYPVEGPAGCLPLLPDRSLASIYAKANGLGLRAPLLPRPGRPRTIPASSDHIDAAIRRAYQSGGAYKGVVRDLAKRLGRPRWWVSRRAIALGVSEPRKKEPPWSAAELEILEDHAHRTPLAIQLRLRDAGYHRTQNAIQLRRKRIGISTADPDRYSATSLALAMGVDPKVVSSWIAKGLLAAKPRGTARTAAQGGDAWEIHRRAVCRFLIDNVAIWDHRKVDRWWLVDTLTGGAK